MKKLGVIVGFNISFLVGLSGDIGLIIIWASGVITTGVVGVMECLRRDKVYGRVLRYKIYVRGIE